MRDLLGTAQPANRDLRHDLRADVLGHGHHQVGADIARRDGIHGDAETRVFLCERDGEAMHARLGRRVIGLAVLALLPIDRADLDDSAPLPGAHAFDNRTGDVEAGVEVGVHHLGPLLVIHLVEGGVAGDAGVVDQDLHRPGEVFHRADHGFRRNGFGHVTRHHHDIDAVADHVFAPGGGAGLVAVIGGDPVTLPCKVTHDRRTDAARAAGHQCRALRVCLASSSPDSCDGPSAGQTILITSGCG